MPKFKTHKGLLKRVRITKSGKVRHRSAYHKHLSSHKSGKRLRKLRKDPYASSSDAKKFEKLLFRRLRGKNQVLNGRRRSPSPEERRAIQAERAKAQAES